jgi:hypothetical protein
MKISNYDLASAEKIARASSLVSHNSSNDVRLTLHFTSADLKRRTRRLFAYNLQATAAQISQRAGTNLVRAAPTYVTITARSGTITVVLGGAIIWGQRAARERARADIEGRHRVVTWMTLMVPTYARRLSIVSASVTMVSPRSTRSQDAARRRAGGARGPRRGGRRVRGVGVGAALAAAVSRCVRVR